MSEYGLSMRMADGVEVLNTSNFGVGFTIFTGAVAPESTVSIDYGSSPASLSQVEWIDVATAASFLPTVAEDSVAFQNQCLRVSVGQFVNMARLASTDATKIDKFSVGMFVVDYTPDNRLQLHQVGVEPKYTGAHITSVGIAKYVALERMYLLGLENNV